MLAGEMEAREGDRKAERGRQKGRSSRLNETTQHMPKQLKNLTPKSAHERSVQRSHSAQSDGTTRNPKPEMPAGVLGVKDGIGRHLKTQFETFSKLGDRRSDGAHISCSQSDKWLKQVRTCGTRVGEIVN